MGPSPGELEVGGVFSGTETDVCFGFGLGAAPPDSVLLGGWLSGSGFPLWRAAHLASNSSCVADEPVVYRDCVAALEGVGRVDEVVDVDLTIR